MYSLNKDKQKQLKDFFKLVQKNNKKIEKLELKNVLIELNENKVIFNYTNAYFLIKQYIETDLSFEKKQLFIPESLIEFFCKNSITSIEYDNEKLILKMNYFDKITIEKEKIVIETDNSQMTINVAIENYPDLNLIKDYFKVTENHFTIQLGSGYLNDLISTSKYFKLQIDLTNDEKAVIITTDNGTNAILMPMTLNDKESKDRNKEIQKRIKASDTPTEPVNQ
jgi:hypothetical protein